MEHRGRRNLVVRFVVAGLGISAVGAFLMATAPAGLPARSDSVVPASSPRVEPGSLLDQVLRSHGGVEAWSRADRLLVTASFGGVAFKMRFAEPAPKKRQIEIHTDRPHVVLRDYPQEAQCGVFTPERVWIEACDGGVMVESLDRPREVLLNSRRRQIWWDHLDLLYFAGYAAWNYFQGPFLLTRPGVETSEGASWTERGETWRTLRARFAESVPTHSAEQVFYFDERFRQRRHDYRAVPFAAWAEAAHYTSDYKAFQGLWFPTRRRVVPRQGNGQSRPGPGLVWIEVADIVVETRASNESPVKHFRAISDAPAIRFRTNAIHAD